MKKQICIMLVTLFCVSTSHATMLHFRADPSNSALAGSNAYFTDSGSGPQGSVQQLLIDESLNNPMFETAAESFYVLGQGTVNLTFNFIKDTGAFNGIFGFFDMASVATELVSSNAWKNLAALSAQVVFNDREDALGTSKTFAIQAGTELGFILWANGKNSARYFSVSDANPDGNDANTQGDDMMLSFSGNNKTLFTFEDVLNGDDDYTDLAFTINTALSTSPEYQVSEPDTYFSFAMGLMLIYALRRRFKD